MFNKFKTYLIVAAGLMAFAMAGCSGNDGDNSVTNPIADAIYPKGDIQGKLIDACTQQPIRNATIDIGFTKTTTNDRGQYIIKNVPATKQADGKFHGDYSVTIDLRNAQNPAGQPFAANTYPAFAYDEVQCTFTTLVGSGNSTQDGLATANGNNPAVPVFGLADGSQDFTVGALNGVIRGKVTGTTAKPAAGKYVALYASRSHNGEAGSTNSTTGARENLVKTAIVAEDGTYTFTGIEAQRHFNIAVTDSDPTGATAPKPTKTLWIDADTECAGAVIWACDVAWDAAAPQCLASINRIQHADYQVAAAGTDNFAVKYTFVYPVAAKDNLNGIPVSTDPADQAAAALALSSAGNAHSIFANVKASLEGYKATTVPHSIAWNSTYTELTVTIQNIAPAAIYKVDIYNAEDLFGFDCGCYEIEFYTFGAGTAVQPKVTAINQPYDYNSNIDLSWLPTANAKAYNIYCQAVENWGTTTEPMAWIKLNKSPSLLSVYSFDHVKFGTEWGSPFLHDQTDTFIENWKIKLTYNCKVRGVNADGTENTTDTTDNVVNGIADTKQPAVRLDGSTATSITFCFSEPMSKDPAQTASNFIFTNFTSNYTPPTLSAGIYDVPGKCVTFTMDSALDLTKKKAANAKYMDILPAVKDVAGNSLEVLFLSYPAVAPNN